MLPNPAIIPVQVVYLKIALEIFSVSQAHHAKQGDLFFVERVGKKQHLHAPCHAKMV